MSSALEKQSKTFPQNLLSSELVWTLCFLSIFLVLALFVPVRFLNAADGINGTFRILVTKLSSFLASSEKPEIVILGSSLVLLPAVRCDDRFAGKPSCFDRWYYDRRVPEYTKSTFLEELIRRKTGKEFQIKNLGVASSIMSDQYAIFEMMRAEKKLPRLLILGLAPRDFLDNSQQRHLETPVRQFMREYNEPSFFSMNRQAERQQDFCARTQHRVPMVFAQMRSFGVALACKLTGHPERVEIITTDAHDDHDRENRLKDLETYRRLYNPPNYKMMATQTEYLRKLLLEAKASGLAVLVVNMPLTRENSSVLDSKALLSYEQALENVSRECNASFLNIGSASADYGLKDFEDCCHLNATGGAKFYDALASKLSKDEKIIANLNLKANDFIATRSKSIQ